MKAALQKRVCSCITNAYAKFQLKMLSYLCEQVCVKLLILEGLHW